MANKINVGDKIPSFTSHDHEGLEINSDDLYGSPFVIYFYPKDDTPGCTLEACSFRDNMARLDELDTLVIGVSGDDASSHNQFMKKFDLNFTLLCDENLELAKKFDAVQEKEIDGKKKLSIVRSTFIVDSNGVICWIEKPVSVEGHVDRVLKAVKEIIFHTTR